MNSVKMMGTRCNGEGHPRSNQGWEPHATREPRNERKTGL